MSVASAETGEHRPGSTPAGGAGRLPPLWLNRGALIDGKYEVVRVIGQGGMGRVVEVVCRGDGGRLALKLAHDRGLARRRLIREARILAGLRHPHLLPVLDASLEPDPPYFVMPLAEESLDSELARGGGDLTWALAAFRQVCLGVQALHRAGVVHRDLKPANILRMPDGIYRVADLGADQARPRDSTILTRTCSGGHPPVPRPRAAPALGEPPWPTPAPTSTSSARSSTRSSAGGPGLIEPEGLPRGLGRIVRRATPPAGRPLPGRRRTSGGRGYRRARRRRRAARAGLARAGARRAGPADCRRACGEFRRRRGARRPGRVERLPHDEALEVFDRLPTALLAALGRRFAAVRVAARGPARGLERGCGRRDFHYADRVTRRMKAILTAGPALEVVARAVRAVLIVAVVLNRYSAMAELRRILYQVRGGEQAWPSPNGFESAQYFQEIAPYLERGGSRRPPAWWTTCGRIQTVAF
ncbi:MAG: serine/threonine-protein kinase [Isosphaeraceae bacterium]